MEETSKLVNAESHGQLTKELFQYYSKSGLFESEYLWTDEATDNPIIWWAAFEVELPILSILAKKLMSIPASSAAAERN